MSITKHKLFTIPLDDINGEYQIDNKALQAIDNFFENSNYVYINHSLAVLGKDLRSNTYRDTSLLISLVYKDINSTPNQLINVSNRTKETVRKSIENEDVLPKPKHKTSFDSKAEK